MVYTYTYIQINVGIRTTKEIKKNEEEIKINKINTKERMVWRSETKENETKNKDLITLIKVKHLFDVIDLFIN